MMIKLTVKVLTGEEKSLEVSGNATVGELKQRISQLFSVPVYSQKLCTENGHRIELKDDSQTLRGYGLQSDSLVILLITRFQTCFQVFVKHESRAKPGSYDVTPDETIDELRAKISRTERVQEDQFRLVYNGKELQPGMKLQDYNITPKSTIYTTLRLRGG